MLEIFSRLFIYTCALYFLFSPPGPDDKCSKLHQQSEVQQAEMQANVWPEWHAQSMRPQICSSRYTSYWYLTGFVARAIDLLLFSINFEKNSLIYIVTFEILPTSPGAVEESASHHIFRLRSIMTFISWNHFQRLFISKYTSYWYLTDLPIANLESFENV